MAITFTVNNKPATVDAGPETPLLWVVREHLKLTGTKYGCRARKCGVCAVRLDGTLGGSCQKPVPPGGRRHVRRLHVASRRQGGALLPDARRHGGGQERHHHRGLVGQEGPPVSDGLRRLRAAATRLD